MQVQMIELSPNDAELKVYLPIWACSVYSSGVSPLLMKAISPWHTCIYSCTILETYGAERDGFCLSERFKYRIRIG